MKNAHVFLIATAAGLTAGCAVTAAVVCGAAIADAAQGPASKRARR